MKQPIRIPEIVINYFSALIQVLKPINMSHENKGRICLPDDDNPVAEDQDCLQQDGEIFKKKDSLQIYSKKLKLNVFL